MSFFLKKKVFFTMKYSDRALAYNSNGYDNLGELLFHSLPVITTVGFIPVELTSILNFFLKIKKGNPN